MKFTSGSRSAFPGFVDSICRDLPSAFIALLCLVIPLESIAEVLTEHPRLYFTAQRTQNFSQTFTWACSTGTLNEVRRHSSIAAACSSLDACWPESAPHSKPSLVFDVAAFMEFAYPSRGAGVCRTFNGAQSKGAVIAHKCSPGFDFNDATGLCEKGQPDPCDADARTNAPVQLTTGSKSIREVDFETSGHSLLRFERNWNSQNKRWEFSYGQRLLETTNSHRHFVRIYQPSGWDVTFSETNGIWSPEARVKETLTVDGSNWLYTMSSGDKEWYNASGRLIRTLNTDGRGLNISYPDTTTAVITDDYGIALTLGLDASGRIVTLTDPGGAVHEYAYNAGGNLEFVTFPADGSNPDPIRQYHYEDSVDSALVTKITDENGDIHKRIAYAGSTSRRVTSSGLSDGSVGQSTFSYTNINDIYDPRVTVTNALGKQTVYHFKSYYGSDVVTRIEGADQPAIGCLADVRSKEYYPENGWLKYKTDKAGNRTYYEYFTDWPRRGLLKKRIEGEGSAEARTFTLKYFATRQIEEEILEGVRQTDYTYHPNGKLHTRTETDLTGLADVATRTWTTTYTYHNPGTDTQVAIMAVNGPRTDGVPDITVTEFSPEGYLVNTTNALGQVTQYLNHNGRGQPGRVIDANNIVTDMTYTARGWLNTITQDVGGLNALTDMDYDNVGQLTGITLPDGVHVEFKFDAAHRLYETGNDLGEVIQYVLDAAGNQDEILYRNAGGNVVQNVEYDFDGLSRVWKEFGSYGQQTDYTYDEKDHLTAITATRLAGNLVTEQEFDAQNRMVRVIDAGNEAVSIVYDAEDRVERVTDQRGLVTDYVYDGFGDLQQLVSPDTGTTQYNYDVAGNRTRQTDARGVVTNYTYDALNRLSTVKYPAEPAKNISYNYDNHGNAYFTCRTCNGRLSILQDSSGSTLYFYDALGRMDVRINVVNVPGGSPVGLTTDFDFNTAGRLEQITYPNGQVVKYGFDAAGQVNAVRYKSQAPTDPLKNLATGITYQPFGPMKGATYGNNLKLTRVYDLDGRLDTQAVTGVQSLDYGYDLVNNIEAIDNLIDDSRDETYDYDNLNRLEAATGKYGDVYYDYDAVGNREGRVIVRGSTVIWEDHQIDPDSNRLDQIDILDGTTQKTREFEYDDAGNLIEEKRADGTYRKPVYDATNRMKSVSP
jgi:YD repeat-containing protein